jgi:hypothetical protein
MEQLEPTVYNVQALQREIQSRAIERFRPGNFVAGLKFHPTGKRVRELVEDVVQIIRYLTYPFCLKYSIASPVLRKTLLAVSVMKGDGIPLHAQTT